MKKTISFCLILLCLLLTACGQESKTISTNAALDLINDGAIIIDVRTKEEYDSGHIKDAINVPLDVIDTISYDKDKLIIVYCATGVRSLQAFNELKELGYTNIYNIDGGLLNWGGELEE